MDAFDPIAYINERRPQKSRVCPERIKALLDGMGRPHGRLRFVHVAGTNGKGSTCAYLASVMQAAGYKVGLFTSPYIVEFAERIRVNGVNISLADLTDVTLFVREHVEAHAALTGEYPTEFEVMCAVAFEHFTRCACDIVVCEVGIGGRRDPTNVIERVELSVITRLGFDHQELLGSTLGQIAAEKAGIIKPGVPVVAYPQEDATAARAIAQEAARQGAELLVPDFGDLRVGSLGENGERAFTYAGREFRTCMPALYQPRNAVLAIEAAGLLRERGWDIPEVAVRDGVAHAFWPGRFELAVYGGGPLVVDGAHNAQGAQALRESLDGVFPHARIVAVVGAMQDKDYRSVLRCVLPRVQAVVCVAPPSPRALAAGELARVVREEFGVQAEAALGVREALDVARRICGTDAVICAFGSLYLVGEVEALLR